MGVPKFYRWLSERYPCLSQVIKEHQIPEFDNLYLDMNGIIHPCSHPNDDDPHFRITEAEIFQNIFNYIEVLFRIIKPKKNFFMAVDGCAPRAKMNQQRSRRFRTAKEAENNIRKAQMKGQTLPKEDRFDSNCITPGTEFMARLNNQLQYFVNMKISTDPMWQDCTIYLSGHDVPGEGEHKVMDFIRYCKAQPGYDPNTRHCLYGLDADLIMLGLTSHEPHFALLREEVRFGKQAKRITKPEQQTFHLLHLSLLREYLEFEFGTLKGKIHFKYDIESVIDDWILLGFLVGNDFVPHLPNFHINHDALPHLFGVYKEFLLTTDGYLHTGGYINLHRLKKFFEFLSKFDRNNFEEKYEDFKWLQSKRTGQLLESSHQGSPHKKERKRHTSKQDNSFNDNPYAALANVSGALDDYSLLESPGKPEKKHNKTSLLQQEGDAEVEYEMDNEEMFELEFKQHKRHYYVDKFKMDIINYEENVETICLEYVRALQWIAHYYFNGLQSWSWYYPYHYAPFISDVASFNVQDLHFDIGQPFKPFEQLLAVLPSASRKLLPKAFQNLMIMDNSAIIDYYPPDFESDLNGKQQEWEAVVLIPFIDEKRLLSAMDYCYSSLTDEEKARNSFGKCLKYSYDPSLNFIFPTSYPAIFEDVRACKAHREDIDRTMFHLDVSLLKKGLMEGTQLDVYFPGFPTMRHLQHKSYLKKAGVKVFQYNSRSENMIVKVIQSGRGEQIKTLASSLVGQWAHVEWPYLVEAKIVSVADDTVKYQLDKSGKQIVSELVEEQGYDAVKREMKAVSSFLINRKGIDIGQCDVLVEAKLMLGQRYVCSSNGAVKLEREYAENTTFYPAKTVVRNLTVHQSSAEEYTTIQTLYPAGSTSFIMASSHYGCTGEVIEFDEESNKVRLALRVSPEPNFDEVIKNYDQLSVCYLSEHVVVQKLGISGYLLNRITGDLFVNEHEQQSRNKGTNIGLKIKYSSRNKEAVGFARRVNDRWTYSPTTVDMVKEYIEQFPEVFETVANKSRDNNSFLVADFSKDKAFLGKVKSFLKSLPCNKVETLKCGSNVLDKLVIQSIHDTVEQLKKSTTKESAPIKVKVKPNLIFRPTDQFGKLWPDPDTDFLLFDRVVNVDKGITVPLGLRGTVVGIYEVPIDENDQYSPTELRYEVMFDDQFLGANNVRHVEQRGYFMNGYSLLNISYGNRKQQRKKGEKASQSTKFQQKITSNEMNASGGSGRSSSTPSKGASSSYRGRLGPNRSDSNLNQTPDPSPFWLKGKYRNEQQQSSPQQQQQQQQHYGKQQHQNQDRRKSNNNKQQHGHAQNGSSKTTSTPAKTTTSGTDFLNMWKELQKVESETTEVSNASPHHKPQEKVDQDATKTLHQLLNINKQGQQQQQQQQQHPQQQQQHQQAPQPHHLPPQLQQQQYQVLQNARVTSSPSAGPPQVQLLQRGPPPPQQPVFHNQANSFQKGPSMGPAVIPPFMQPSMILLQCCTQMKLQQPQYLFTIRPGDGIQASIAIGERYFNGQIQPSQPEAMESAASVALCQLTGVPAFPVNFLQNQQPNQASPYRPQQQQTHQQQFQSPMHHQGSPRQNFPYQQSPNGNRTRQSRSDTGLQTTSEKKSTHNPFVPHQVSVKNSKREVSNDKRPRDVNPTTHGKAESDLKEILGIIPTPTNNKVSSAPAAKKSEGDLKKILGIREGGVTNNQQQPHLQQVQHQQQQQQFAATAGRGGGEGVDIGKQLLAGLDNTNISEGEKTQLSAQLLEVLNQNTQQPPTALESELTDGMKLMNLIGIKPIPPPQQPQFNNRPLVQESSSEPSLLPSQQNKMTIETTQKIVKPLEDTKTFPLSTPAAPKDASPVPTSSPSSNQTVTSPALNSSTTSNKPSSKPSSNNSSARSSPITTSGGTSTPTKKPILLAPSFFGPKKK